MHTIVIAFAESSWNAASTKMPSQYRVRVLSIEYAYVTAYVNTTMMNLLAHEDVHALQVAWVSST